MSETIKYRTYKISVNFFFISIYNNSKVYKIKNGKSTVLPGLKYSLVTVFFGWWGLGLPWKAFQKIKNSMTALHINFSGGEDYTKAFTEMDYEEKTVWVYNNLNRETSKNLTIETADIIIELQNEFVKSNAETINGSNLRYLSDNLKKIGIENISKTDFEEVLNKYEQFNYRSL